MCGTDIRMLVDTESTVNIIDSQTYQMKQRTPMLRKPGRTNIIMHTDHTSQLQCVVNSRRQSQPMEAPLKLKCISLLPRLAIFYAVMPPMCWDWFISFEAQRTSPTGKPTKSAANIHVCARVSVNSKTTKSSFTLTIV